MNRPLEEILQSYLDGELDPVEAARVRERIETDPDARARHAILVAAREALESVAPEPVALPPEVEARLRQTLEAEESLEARAARRWSVPFWVQASLAAAAVLLVTLLVLQKGPDREDPGRPVREATGPLPETEPPVEDWVANDHLRIRLVKEARPAALLDDAVFSLLVAGVKPGPMLCLVPIRPGQSLAARAEELVTRELLSPPKAGIIPCVLRARITTPGGTTLEAHVACPDSLSLSPIFPFDTGKISIKVSEASFAIPLSHLLVRRTGARNYFAFYPEKGGERVVNPRKAHYYWHPEVEKPAKGEASHEEPYWESFFLAEAGRYRIALSLETLPARPEYSWPTFAEPLTASCTIDVSGVVGPWSEPVNGLRFRLATPRPEYRKGAFLPILLQIQNDAGEVRRYNFMGTTMAKIPQPYHFEFRVNDAAQPAVEGQYAEGVVFFSDQMFAHHRPGELRTLALSGGFWTQDGRALNDIAGPQRLACRFHFQPSIWRVEDRTIWMGEVNVPPIEYLIRE